MRSRNDAQVSTKNLALPTARDFQNAQDHFAI
jgi:hypothetical protein